MSTWRFKTEKEFLEEYGEDWRGMVGWRSVDNAMDYLLGTPYDPINNTVAWSTSNRMFTDKPLPQTQYRVRTAEEMEELYGTKDWRAIVAHRIEGSGWGPDKDIILGVVINEEDTKVLLQKGCTVLSGIKYSFEYKHRTWRVILEWTVPITSTQTTKQIVKPINNQQNGKDYTGRSVEVRTTIAKISRGERPTGHSVLGRAERVTVKSGHLRDKTKAIYS